MSWIRIGEVSRILVCNRDTILRDIAAGQFPVRVERDLKGRLFHIYDVFKYAYPWADDDVTIGKLIMQYREDKVQRLKSLRNQKLNKLDKLA